MPNLICMQQHNRIQFADKISRHYFANRLLSNQLRSSICLIPSSMEDCGNKFAPIPKFDKHSANPNCRQRFTTQETANDSHLREIVTFQRICWLLMSKQKWFFNKLPVNQKNRRRKRVLM